MRVNCAAACCVALLALPALARGADRYTVSATPDLDQLTVRACFEGRPPQRLAPADGDDLRWLNGVRSRGTLRVARLRDGLALSGGGHHDCLEYDIALAAASRGHTARADDAERLLPSGAWLWRPPDRTARVRFELPRGVAASLPWTPHPGGWVPGPTQGRWSDLTAFGRFEERRLDVPGSRLRLAVLGGADPDAMATWLAEAARAVATVHGRFPVPQAQLLVVPIGSRGEPVPWAQVRRGGGPGAHFFVDPTRPLAEFRADWTATHELSHFLLPFVARRDAWFSEGVASWFQNVARARAGMLPEEEAWQRLHDGFQRGMAATDGASTLRAVTAAQARGRGGAVMRIYWSGAALWMLADLEWRRQGTDSERALAGLADCCLQGGRTWSARELAERLDALAGAPALVPLVERWLDSNRFPDLAAAYDELGLVADGGSLRLDARPAAQSLRRAIMSAAMDAAGTAQ